MKETIILVTCLAAVFSVCITIRLLIKHGKELATKRVQVLCYRDTLRVFIERMQDLEIDGSHYAYKGKVFPNTYTNCVQYEIDKLRKRCKIIEGFEYDIYNNAPEITI